MAPVPVQPCPSCASPVPAVPGSAAGTNTPFRSLTVSLMLRIVTRDSGVSWLFGAGVWVLSEPKVSPSLLPPLRMCCSIADPPWPQLVTQIFCVRDLISAPAGEEGKSLLWEQFWRREGIVQGIWGVSVHIHTCWVSQQNGSCGSFGC